MYGSIFGSFGLRSRKIQCEVATLSSRCAFLPQLSLSQPAWWLISTQLSNWHSFNDNERTYVMMLVWVYIAGLAVPGWTVFTFIACPGRTTSEINLRKPSVKEAAMTKNKQESTHDQTIATKKWPYYFKKKNPAMYANKVRE